MPKVLAFLALLLLVRGSVVHAQQVADIAFDTHVAQPASPALCRMELCEAAPVRTDGNATLVRGRRRVAWECNVSFEMRNARTAAKGRSRLVQTHYEVA